jgi:hypothetical protein
VTTNGFDLFVNGTRMVIKGINYSPVPIGVMPGDPPYGDYFVPAYSNVWTPDIQNMRAAGVNAIKLYAGNPGLNAGAPGSAGNWKQFLDACYNGGSNPIYVVMFSYVQGMSSRPAELLTSSISPIIRTWLAALRHILQSLDIALATRSLGAT